MSAQPPDRSAPGDPESAGPPRPSPSTMLVHFYRAVVGHADVWRQRMDATTNWAAATTAAIITFTFNADSPHFVLLLAFAFDGIFLLMESRRYQTYHLWRRRFHALNRYLIAPALAEHTAPEAKVLREEFRDLALDLGRTAPHLRLRDAVGFRIHRNYGYLFGIVLLAWVLKLGAHPEAITHAGQLVERARVGFLPGGAVWGAVGAFLLISTYLAVRAPTEGMVDWSPSPTLWARLTGHGRPAPPPPGPDEPLTGPDA